MNKEQKIEFAKKIYEKSGFVDINVEFKREEDLNADYFYVPVVRGPGALIIGDDGTFLFCPSSYSYEYSKEQYKKGIRSK